MNTYPEMNEKIVDILRVSGTPTDMYAAQYIEELQKSEAEWHRLYDCAVASVTDQPKWIRARDRLPEFSGWNLVTCDELGGWITRIAIYDAWDNFQNRQKQKRRTNDG